jgi:predicted N-acyltransferase
MMERRLSSRILRSVEEVSAKSWDACANHSCFDHFSPKETFNPFISHSFLKSLEISASVGRDSGWQPLFPIIEDDIGNIVAAAPAYLKSHSFGEYVFDATWAEAYERAGGTYYPKIQIAIPFTPVGGRRLFTTEHPDEELKNLLLKELRMLRETAKASSLHITFCNQEEAQYLSASGFASRIGEQFHFTNKNYKTFDDFLNNLTARKRKMIKKERKEAVSDNISIERLVGKDIKAVHLDRIYYFYMHTNSRKWGRPYLTRQFFEALASEMPDRLFLIMAKRHGAYIAGAINFLGDMAIYGRNWGAIEAVPFLHFEVCYYQAIEYAIEYGYARVEAGAQGEHKLARGYLSTPTFSVHEFADPLMNDAISHYLSRERKLVSDIIHARSKESPYRF